MDDLRRVVDDMERLYLSPSIGEEFPTFIPPGSADAQDEAIAVFKQNWESVISQQQRLGTALLTRVARMQDDVRGLRDDVRDPLPETRPPSRVLVLTSLITS